MGTTAGASPALGPQSLGEALRLLRHRIRWSRDDLARAAGVSAGAISNYENDVSTPPAPTLRRITLALAESMAVESAQLWDQLGRLMDDASPGDSSTG